MPLIKIKQTRINLTTGNKLIKLDSALLSQMSHQNLGDVLANESSIFIKNYGPSNLSSSSFRGGNAAQTSVLWNGFQLNNTLNGQVDFSLIPTGFHNDVTIQYGGSSALWGSGALGGAIFLATKPQWEKGFQAKLNFTVSSFSNFQQQLSLGWGNKKISSNLQLLHQTAKNNFDYLSTDKKLNEQQIQTNAEQKTSALKYDLFYSINARQQIQFSFWKQFNNRNIAPTILQTSSDANQKDNATRISAEWSNQRKKNKEFFRTAFFNENLFYTSNNIVDTNSVKTWIVETEKKWVIRNKDVVNSGINFTQNWATLNSISALKTQHNFSLFASYTMNFKKTQTTFSARQQFWNLNKIPFTFSIGTAYSIFKNVELKANFSKVYRLPTLNDLYWNPGGNINLLPENGYTQDVGVKVFSHLKAFYIKTEATLFSKKIKNWIQWQPQNNFWTPKNILEVWSRGLETNTEIEWRKNDFNIKLNAMTTYIVSTNQIKTSQNDASVDKQLIYVPMYSGFVKMSVGYKNLLLQYRQNYIGYRYTSTDNSEFLKPYYLGNFYASYLFDVKKYRTTLFFQINNIWNTSYQVVQNYAMPLQHFSAGIQIQFN